MDKKSNNIQISSTADNITLKDLFLKLGTYRKYILSRWKLIVLFTLLGCLLGFAYAYFNKPIYIAQSTFVLEESSSGGGGLLGQYAGIASMAGVDIGGSGGGIFQGDNILQLYRSHAMIERALLSPVAADKNQLLIDKYIAFKKLRQSWEDKPALKNIKFTLKPGEQFSRLQDSVISKIIEDINNKSLSVSKPDKKLSIIQVSVNAQDEEFAKEFNNEIVKTVNDFYVQTKSKKAIQNLAILQHQTDSVKSALGVSIYNSVANNDATPNLNPAKLVLRVPSQQFQLNAEANKAILAELIKNLELAKISLRKEAPLIQMVDEPVYPLVKEKISKIKGAVIGALLGAILIIIYILGRKFYKEVMA